MVFEKKYWSEGEFTHKDGSAYTGYVGISDREGYVYDNEEPLEKVDSWKVQMNSSDYFYDRILDEEIELPYTKEDVQFGANDFLTSSTLRNIILKLQENNDYIFRNTIISNTLLPATNNCSVLATYNDPHYFFKGKSEQLYAEVTEENMQDILDGYVQAEVDALDTFQDWPLKVGDKPQPTYTGNYFKIPNVVIEYNLKNGYLHQYPLDAQTSTRTALDPTFYPQVDSLGNVKPALYNFNDLVHADMCITKIEGIAGQDGAKILHLMIFLLFKDKLLIFRYKYYYETEGTNEDINFNKGSEDVLVLTAIDPANKNSITFLGLKDIELHGNYMYLVDETLNMVLRYDIAYLLHDESELGFSLKSIRLLDNLSGDGTVNDNIYFMKPNSIAVDDNWIYVCDNGNKCIKKYTSSFDYEVTLRNGQFATHDIQSIAINPYSPTLDNGIKLEPGSLWVFSTSGTGLYVSIIVGTTTVYSAAIDKIQLLKDIYTWDEEFKSVKFSFTNSNYYYISTTKRVYKLHLSKPTYPFASLSYFRQRQPISTMVWNSVPYPWHLLPATDDLNITWSYRPQKTSAEVLDNRAFAICGADSITKTLENSATEEQFDGDLIFHIGNFYDQQKVDTYIKRTGVKFNQIPVADLAQMIKCSGLFLYCEPSTYIYSVSNPNVACYIKEDIQNIENDEYVNPITFNSHIYKVIYNLLNLKNIIIGRFQGAYNLDNLMVFDQLLFDNYWQQLKIEDNHNYFIHNNEPTSIIVNRVFEAVWSIQEQMLEHIKAKYISIQSFTNNTFRII